MEGANQKLKKKTITVKIYLPINILTNVIQVLKERLL